MSQHTEFIINAEISTLGGRSYLLLCSLDVLRFTVHSHALTF
jgi:hypothetical protein